MKATVNHKQKILAAILLVAYLFTVSTYIIFLKSRVVPVAGEAFAKTITVKHLASNQGEGNFYDKQHGAFKSTSPKRKVISAIWSLAFVALFTVTQALRFFCNNPSNSFCGSSYTLTRSYLSLGVLRI